ncbi:MAG: hypothetical protein U0805_01505 [Pirellulales bacterium]
MPIQVTCPNPKCLKRFSVADKFAGQKGPCPKCKTIITIPKKEEEVVIHAPEHSETGAIDATGRNVLKTYKRKDTKFQPLVFTTVVAAVLVAVLVALVLRGEKGNVSIYLLAAGAIVFGPPLAWAGYTFLRDPELEAYSGVPLIIRSLACGLVYALLWALFVFLGQRFFGPDAMAKGLEIWQMVVLIIPVFAGGTLAAFASFDLEPGSAFFHCAMYFAVTVILRLVAALPAVPGLGHA